MCGGLLCFLRVPFLLFFLFDLEKFHYQAHSQAGEQDDGDDQDYIESVHLGLIFLFVLLFL